MVRSGDATPLVHTSPGRRAAADVLFVAPIMDASMDGDGVHLGSTTSGLVGCLLFLRAWFVSCSRLQPAGCAADAAAPMGYLTLSSVSRHPPTTDRQDAGSRRARSLDE